MESVTIMHRVFEIMSSINVGEHGHIQVDTMNVVELKAGIYLELRSTIIHRKRMILFNDQGSGM